MTNVKHITPWCAAWQQLDVGILNSPHQLAYVWHSINVTNTCINAILLQCQEAPWPDARSAHITATPACSLVATQSQQQLLQLVLMVLPPAAASASPSTGKEAWPRSC